MGALLMDPRRNENEHGHSTREPDRTKFEPRQDLPDPDSVEQSGVAQHWRKHPSDYHADCAVSHLSSAFAEPDTIRRGHELQMADIYARLSLRDAVLEMTATVKEAVSRQCDTMREFDGHIQTAAQHLHRDAADLKQHLRVVQGEAAA